MSLIKSDTARARSNDGAKSVRKPAKKKPDAVATDAVPMTTAPRAPSHDEIAARAYAIFASRGFVHGSSNDDWLKAERELVEVRARG